MKRLLPFAILTMVTGCGDDDASPDTARETVADAAPDGNEAPDYADPGQIEARLMSTLETLAAFGEKRAGTAAGRAAGDYLQGRFEAAGLDDVAYEAFDFIGYELVDKEFEARVDETPVPMKFEVFAYSGFSRAEQIEALP